MSGGDQQATKSGGSAYLGMGALIGIGAGFGLVLGLLLGNMVLGMLAGASIGTVAGAVLETLRKRDEDAGSGE